MVLIMGVGMGGRGGWGGGGGRGMGRATILGDRKFFNPFVASVPVMKKQGM